VTPTALRRHDATVRRLAGRTDAVLPIRFGTVVGDRLALARALAPRAAGLREALALVAGHEQMTLRVYGEAVSTSDESAAEPAGAGQRYLARAFARGARPRSIRSVARSADSSAPSGSSATSGRRCWPASTTSSGAATASAIWPRSPRPALAGRRACEPEWSVAGLRVRAGRRGVKKRRTTPRRRPASRPPLIAREVRDIEALREELERRVDGVTSR